MNPFVIIIYGSPGSGKSTQADVLAKYFSLEHFNTGRTIEKIVHDESKKDDPIIQRERQLFDSGILCTPEWVTEMVKKVVVDLRQAGQGIIFSGSPRTLYEAGQIIPLLEELYSQSNIHIFEIKVKPEMSIFRNTKRRVCERCGRALIYTVENEKMTSCSDCGGNLVTRTLDASETIQIRLGQYTERTLPIFSYLRERGLEIVEVDGEPMPEEVTRYLLEKLPSI